ncbi:IDEAL domain-containing protein [Cytobacillus firmus]|uniref:IDEAL domain-containing protein n=1 Tax=Cytobacillus firmus TaxID=1399 RepID=UPI003B9FAB51
MEVSKKAFAKGEWVAVVNTRLVGCKGYILNHLWGEGYKVKITKDSQGNSINAIIWIGAEDIVSCEEKFEKDDLLALIDFALATNDKQWFMELTSQLPEALLQ